MSGEFGYEFDSGDFFHRKIERAADDALGSDNKITILWGEFLDELSHIAKAISYYEAADTSIDGLLDVTLKWMPQLKHRLVEIDKYVKKQRKRDK